LIPLHYTTLACNHEPPNITIVLNAHHQEEKKLRKDAQVTTWFEANLNTKPHINIFFGGKMLHLCELKNAKATRIKELATINFAKKNL
jgi:hypothetical protein